MRGADTEFIPYTPDSTVFIVTPDTFFDLIVNNVQTAVLRASRYALPLALYGSSSASKTSALHKFALALILGSLPAFSLSVVVCAAEALTIAMAIAMGERRPPSDEREGLPLALLILTMYHIVTLPLVLFLPYSAVSWKFVLQRCLSMALLIGLVRCRILSSAQRSRCVRI